MSEDSEVLNRRAKRILIVDDDAAVREMLVRVLADDGYEASAAADGSEALNFEEALHFDLVLLDLGMPRKDGWETFGQLRRQHPGVPVVIITARPNQRARAMTAGAAALLEKPLDFPELLQVVGRLLTESSNLQKTP